MENQDWIMPTHIVAVAGIVLNEKDEILLVKGHREGWTLPGGQVEIGENLMEALRREIMEETGMEADVGELFCVSSNVAGHSGGRQYGGAKYVPTKVILDFICRATGGVLRGSDENDESAFVPKEKVMDMLTFPAIIARYQAYLDYAGRPTYLAYVTRPEFSMKCRRLI